MTNAGVSIKNAAGRVGRVGLLGWKIDQKSQELN